MDVNFIYPVVKLIVKMDLLESPNKFGDMTIHHAQREKLVDVLNDLFKQNVSGVNLEELVRSQVGQAMSEMSESYIKTILRENHG